MLKPLNTNTRIVNYTYITQREQQQRVAHTEAAASKQPQALASGKLWAHLSKDHLHSAPIHTRGTLLRQPTLARNRGLAERARALEKWLRTLIGRVSRSVLTAYAARTLHCGLRCFSAFTITTTYYENILVTKVRTFNNGTHTLTLA